MYYSKTHIINGLCDNSTHSLPADSKPAGNECVDKAMTIVVYSLRNGNRGAIFSEALTV